MRTLSSIVVALLLAVVLVGGAGNCRSRLSAESFGPGKQPTSGLGYARSTAERIRQEGRKTLRDASRLPGAIAVPVPPPGSPGTPAYANFSIGFLPNDGKIAGLTFFRDPTCVRPDFNLLDWIDPPAAFGCPLEPDFAGYTLRDAEASPPWGLEIHWKPTIYFVDYEELLAAVADDVLTILELEALPSLRIGDADRADYYVVNDFAPAPISDGDGHEWFAAEGTMRDGRSFVFAYEEAHLLPEDVHVFPRAVVHFHGGSPAHDE